MAPTHRLVPEKLIVRHLDGEDVVLVDEMHDAVHLYRDPAAFLALVGVRRVRKRDIGDYVVDLDLDHRRRRGRDMCPELSGCGYFTGEWAPIAPAGVAA